MNLSDKASSWRISGSGWLCHVTPHVCIERQRCAMISTLGTANRHEYSVQCTLTRKSVCVCLSLSCQCCCCSPISIVERKQWTARGPLGAPFVSPPPPPPDLQQDPICVRSIVRRTRISPPPPMSWVSFGAQNLLRARVSGSKRRLPLIVWSSRQISQPSHPVISEASCLRLVLLNTSLRGKGLESCTINNLRSWAWRDSRRTLFS